MYEHDEEIEWNCEKCGDPLNRHSYVTRVTTVTGEVIKAEDGRIIDMEPQFPPEEENLCYNCYTKKYKEPVEALRAALGTVAHVIELLEGEANDDFYNPKEALDKLNDLVVYIAGALPKTTTLHLTAVIRKEEDDPMKATTIGILWVDDEGNETVEEIGVGTTKEVGSILTSLLTVKEIVIREKEEVPNA